MPPPNLELSVFRIDGLSIAEIWGLGKSIVSQMPKERNLHGVADIKAKIVERESLTINADNNPERHASIVGWPEEQAQQLSIAQALAAEARLILNK
jgi:hypothetical protein